VLAELVAAVMVRGVSTALATPFQGQHLHGSGSSPQRATAIVCRDENQVLLRLSQDGECVYLKYPLARNPYCHAPLPSSGSTHLALRRWWCLWRCAALPCMRDVSLALGC
jgi:hypothetical protein